jgi:hypothetical protein
MTVPIRCSCGLLVSRIDPVRGRGHAQHAPVHGRGASTNSKLIQIKTQDMPGPSGRRERLMDSAMQQASMPELE